MATMNKNFKRKRKSHQISGGPGKKEAPKSFSQSTFKKNKKKFKGKRYKGKTISNRPEHPFVADELDHCETPVEAYEDISLLLDVTAKLLKKTRKTLRIYDPYYCDGSVKKRLGAFGFENVYNECEDFYDDSLGPSEDDYDVIVTNPPYSGDHMEKLLVFCLKVKKPIFLLLPHYVYTKPYYKSLIPESINMFYICPGMGRRYTYLPPVWAAGHDKPTTSPFPSFWYCNGFNHNKSIIDALALALSNGGNNSKKQQSRYERFRQKLVLCRSIKELPNELRGEFDVSRKRPSPKQRKKLAKRRAQLRFGI